MRQEPTRPVGESVPATGSPMERRMVLRVLTHWRGIAGDRAMPQPGEIRFDSAPELAPHAFVLSASESGMEFAFGAIGPAIGAGLPEDLVGKPVAFAPQRSLISQAARYYPSVLSKRVPISVGGDFRDDEGRMVLYRSILLPLGDGALVTGLLGAANCRAVTSG